MSDQPRSAKALAKDLRVAELESAASALRQDIVEVLTEVGPEHRGHPGASLSIVDIVTALYFEVMRIDPARPDWADRDRFVLSKGHGCLAVYVALARLGYFERRHLSTFRCVDSILQGHPDMRRTPGVDMTSGSLGHGVSVGVGLALDARARRSPTRVFVVLGDGELQEGLVWEGAMAAAKYRLANLTAFVDCNGLQSSGTVESLMPVEPLAAKWRAFGWRVLEIDGHDFAQILAAAHAARRSRRPTVILARTIKGKGVPYMEGDNRWHQACPTVGGSAITGVAVPAPLSERALESTRAAFGETLVQLVREGCDLMVVSSDTRSSMGLDAFARQYPERHVEVGIAEQNLVTVAAGLAAAGRPVFAATYATFASMRALEQVRTFVAYPRLPVVIVAGLGGLSAGIEGVAHLAVEDIGILRCVPGLVILNPADAVATRSIVRAAFECRSPVYIRLGRDDTPVLFPEGYPFLVGKGVVLRQQGWDVVLMTSGLITSEVLGAADLLARSGLGCTVVEFPTVKPIDDQLVLQVRGSARHLFTVEEHSVIGGLGGAVMEVLADSAPAVVHRIGIGDRFLESGTPQELREKFHLTAQAIVARVLDVCRAAPRGAGEEGTHHGVGHTKEDCTRSEGFCSVEGHDGEKDENDG